MHSYHRRICITARNSNCEVLKFVMITDVYMAHNPDKHDVILTLKGLGAAAPMHRYSIRCRTSELSSNIIEVVSILNIRRSCFDIEEVILNKSLALTSL